MYDEVFRRVWSEVLACVGLPYRFFLPLMGWLGRCALVLPFSFSVRFLCSCGSSLWSWQDL